MILIIDNYDSFTYNLYQAVALFYDDIRVFRNDRITIEEVKALNPNGIILSPGPGRPEQAGICIELVRQVDINLPILGVCLGHQVIATAFGSHVVRAPEIVHGKHDLIFHHGQGIYRHLSTSFQSGRYHSLIVDRDTLVPELCVEAENASGLIMGIRHRDRPIFGVQFHPESILTPNGDTLLQAFVQYCESSSHYGQTL